MEKEEFQKLMNNFNEESKKIGLKFRIGGDERLGFFLYEDKTGEDEFGDYEVTFDEKNGGFKFSKKISKKDFNLIKNVLEKIPEKFILPSEVRSI